MLREPNSPVTTTNARTKAVVGENMAGGGGDLRGVYNRAYAGVHEAARLCQQRISNLLGFGG